MSGRVLEVGAGIGTNFRHYPDTVEQVVAVEPEPRLVAQARAAADVVPVRVAVTAETAEGFSADEPFDAVVCSLVLCSVRDPDSVLQRLYSLLRPGGELRYLEHVASAGVRGRFQRLADATLWPRLLGNCHTHRDTERSILEAGFEVGHVPARVDARRSGRRCRCRSWRWAARAGLDSLSRACAHGVARPANRDLCAGSGRPIQFRRGLDARRDYVSRAGSRSNRPGKAWLAVSRTLIVALRDSGVTSGLTSITAVPRDSASSASPAAG